MRRISVGRGTRCIPTEKVSEVKGGKKKITTRKFFPGYMLVEMELYDETRSRKVWYFIRQTNGISVSWATGADPAQARGGDRHPRPDRGQEGEGEAQGALRDRRNGQDH